MNILSKILISFPLMFSEVAFAYQICTNSTGSNVYTVDQVPPPDGSSPEAVESGVYVQIKQCKANTPESNHCLSAKMDDNRRVVAVDPEADDLSCSDYGTYHFNAIAQIAERAHTSLLKFYIFGFASLPFMGLPMVLIAASDRLLDTHIIFTAQDGKAAAYVKKAYSRDVAVYPFDYPEFEEKLAVALAAAKALESDPDAIKEVKNANGNPVPTPGKNAIQPSGDNF